VISWFDAHLPIPINSNTCQPKALPCDGFMMSRLHEFLSQWGLTVHGLVTLAGLVVYVIASHTRRQRRHPSAAIAWVVSLALMPYLALPLYLLFGSRKVTRGPLLRDTPALPVNGPPSSAPAYRFQQLAAAMGLPHAAAYEQLAIHQDGKEALAALRSVLLEARETLDICTFFLGRDALGQEVSALRFSSEQRAAQKRQARSVLLFDLQRRE